jgi:hypothetical protein
MGPVSLIVSAITKVLQSEFPVARIPLLSSSQRHAFHKIPYAQAPPHSHAIHAGLGDILALMARQVHVSVTICPCDPNAPLRDEL